MMDGGEFLRMLAVMILGATLGTALGALVYLVLISNGWWPTSEAVGEEVATLLGGVGALVGMMVLTLWWGSWRYR